LHNIGEQGIGDESFIKSLLNSWSCSSDDEEEDDEKEVKVKH
jgi:hypothetical protein